MRFIAVQCSEVERREGLIALLHFVMEWTLLLLLPTIDGVNLRKEAIHQLPMQRILIRAIILCLELGRNQDLAAEKKLWFCLHMIGLLTAPGSDYI